MAHMMKHQMILVSATVVLVICLFCNGVFAEPYLQLDANPAVYDDESISTELDFTLYALVNSKNGKAKGKVKGKGKKQTFGVDGSFYIAATIVPNIPEMPPDADLGSIFIDGFEIFAVSDMLQGTLPGMPPHGAYPTYYYEHEFTLDPGMRTALYNSQDNPGGPGPIDPEGLLYFGDFDPTGLDIPRNIKERLEEFGVDFEFHRLAITDEQIKQHNIPPIPTKKTDSRTAGFVAKHGDRAVELDALNPKVLQKLIDDSITQYLDKDLYDETLQEQEEDLTKIGEFIDKCEIEE